MPFRVFISHSVEDSDIVNLLATSLEMNGIEPYVAEEYPQPGGWLANKVVTAIDSSNCVVGLLTWAGRQSVFVQHELACAIGKGKLVVPVVEGGEALKGLLAGMEYMPFDRANPVEAISRVVDHLIGLRACNDEERNKAWAIVGLGLFALFVASGTSQKKQ